MQKAATSLLRATTPLLPIALALGTAACGGATPEGNFPTRDELLKITSSPAPQNVLDQRAVDVDSWELRGPLPDTADGSAADTSTPWTGLLAGVTAKRPGLVVLTRAMECAARQVAAFAAEKDALPAPPLARFIAARCGVPTGNLGMGYRGGEIPENATDDALYARYQADVKADIEPALGAGNRFAGIGFARAGKRAAVAIVTAPRLVHLESVPLAPEAGKVVLKGEILQPAESIRVLVTQGRFGFDTCIQDIDVHLPRFSIECAASPDDPTARVEIAAFPAGRELGDSVVDLVVYPAGDPGQTYTRAAGGTDAPAGAAVPDALVAQINAVRKEAGIPEVRLSDAQSRTAALLAPHYFAALSGEVEETVADKVALGLMAGWDVGGAVREGHFTSQWVPRLAPGALVEAAIASPFGREALLDRSVSLIAVGPVTEKSALGAIFSTYSLIDTSGKVDHASAMLARLTKLRGKIKRAAPEPAPELLPAMAEAVAALEGGETLEDALDVAVKKGLAAITAGRVASWVAVASSVEKVQLPSELLSRQSLRLSVAAARYRPAGSPWTRLAFLFVAVEDTAPMNTAVKAKAVPSAL